MTVRAMVASIQNEVRRGGLTPERAGDLQCQLSALLGNIAEEMRDADMAYSDVLLQCMHVEEKANRARIVAETTPAYRRKREAKDVHTVAVELIRSLRQVLRTQQEEMRLQR